MARDGAASRLPPAAAAGRAGSDAGARGAAFVRTAAALQDHPPPWYTKTIEWLPSHPHLFDLLYLNERGELCEGSRSNVYLRLGEHWYTPPVDCGCLPGCSAPSCWKPARRRKVLTLADLHAADGIRLSNALRGWIDVTLRAA